MYPYFSEINYPELLTILKNLREVCILALIYV